jgi:hypothetical protein
VQRAGQTGRARADDQDIRIEFFARRLHFFGVASFLNSEYPTPPTFL